MVGLGSLIGCQSNREPVTFRGFAQRECAYRPSWTVSPSNLGYSRRSKGIARIVRLPRFLNPAVSISGECVPCGNPTNGGCALVIISLPILPFSFQSNDLITNLIIISSAEHCPNMERVRGVARSNFQVPNPVA